MPPEIGAHYGITQPSGGTTKASTRAVQAGLGAGLSLAGGNGRWSATAAIVVDPAKLTHPCIEVPGKTIVPKQIAGDPTPGQRSPHMNGPGSIAIRAIRSPSGATLARTAAMAEGQGSPWKGDDGASVSRTHRTVAAAGVSVAGGVLVGNVPVGAAVRLGASD